MSTEKIKEEYSKENVNHMSTFNDKKQSFKSPVNYSGLRIRENEIIYKTNFNIKSN